MKVIYYSPAFFSDCDFPLIKALQKKGIDIRYYIPLNLNFQKSGLLEFDKPIRKWGIFKASEMKEMTMYKDCIDLNHLYFICGFVSKWWFPMSWLLYLYVFFHMLSQRADVFHFTWQFNCFERLLFLLKFTRKIMTVHDPIQHSGLNNYEKNEKSRVRCFKWADNFILLNNVQIADFSSRYGIDKRRIKVSHLGVYDALGYIESPDISIKSPYIIFFGQISPHKGLEYLLEAMRIVHREYPELKLLIAGSGDLYFDVTPYENIDFVIWENRYVGIRELISMVKNSFFAVCPYKDATQSGVIQTAFALDVPVVATNVGVLPSIVEDGIFGRIVPACNSKALGEAICELIESPETLKRMRENILRQWLPAMSWTSIANDYVKLYNICNEKTA